ncbi:MAG TPA: indole-3-glycerol phosphate synthase TrpC [Bacteroidota bacterium]|nr:indole-3-glycerol phosphate synthase TrpC [Bacteroidota bacterium]
MNILESIVAAKRREISARRAKIKMSSFREQEHFSRSPLSLRSSVEDHPPIGIIAEIKHASPSGGLLRENFDPSVFAREYESFHASGISVLTDREYFSGSLDDLRKVREAVSIPVLRKDFLIDEFQLFEARAHGADAVLLIASILDQNHLRDLVLAAGEIGLETLVEVYDVHELDRLDFNLMRFIGINNRDLRTMQIDLRHSLEIAGRIPAGTTIISESGITRADDLLLLLKSGIRGALIGEYFMRSERPGHALRNILEELDHESGS